MNDSVDLQGLAIERNQSKSTGVTSRRHIWTRYVLPSLLLLGFLVLVGWAARDSIFPPRPVAVMPVVTSVANVRTSGTPLFKAAGWVEPRPTPLRVAAMAPGVVEKLMVVEDQPVDAGEPIAMLVKADAELAYRHALADQKLKQAELAKAKATLNAAQTKLKQPVHLEVPLREAEASLAKVKTELKNLPFQLQRAEADFAAAQKDYDGKVIAKGVVAGVQIEYAKAKLDSARASVEEFKHREVSLKQEQSALSQRCEALKTQLQLLADEIKAKESAEALVDVAEAGVEKSEVAVDEAKLRLERMIIRAPVTGRVYRLISHPGAKVGGNVSQHLGQDGSTVVTMYQPEMLQIRVDVRFEDIPKVVLGQPVKIDNPALSTSITGKVLFVSSEADIQKNTLEVKVAITDPPQVLKPEMLVDVTFLAPKQTNDTKAATQELKIYLPKELISQDADGFFVWLADQSAGVARKTAIKIGAEVSGGLVEIVDGLNVSSRVITQGASGLSNGDRIRITEDGSLGLATNVTSTSSQGEPD